MFLKITLMIKITVFKIELCKKYIRGVFVKYRFNIKKKKTRKVFLTPLFLHKILDLNLYFLT